jgi:SAM-dependent methyltransferase
MHSSAYNTASQFFEVYVAAQPIDTIVEIGSRQVAEGHRNLRELCPPHLKYLGVDLEPGINVDIVLDDPYLFPLADSSVDIVICSSVFEHCDFFWVLFEEALRILKLGGLLYVNAPSNGYVHRHPVDCWRFYPDSGAALVQWGRRQGYDVALLESFITDEDLTENPDEIWQDFVAVFIKGENEITRYPQRMTDLRNDYANARRLENTNLLRHYHYPGRSQEEVSRWLRSASTSRRVYLYQIAYSEETWRSVPTSLLPLDNRANERQDWAEYWPIRQFLQNEILDENALYGFLSPRLAENFYFPPRHYLNLLLPLPTMWTLPYFHLSLIFERYFAMCLSRGNILTPALWIFRNKLSVKFYRTLIYMNS